MLYHSTAAHPLWNFSVDLYRHREVAGACLALQDRCGADVNLILTASWLASQELLLSSELLAELSLLSDDWRRQCLQPLRAVRRYLKQQAPQAIIYQESKALELAAERWQQDKLYACCQQYCDVLPRTEGFNSYRINLERYFQGLSQRQDELPLLSAKLIECLNCHLG